MHNVLFLILPVICVSLAFAAGTPEQCEVNRMEQIVLVICMTEIQRVPREYVVDSEIVSLVIYAPRIPVLLDVEEPVVNLTQIKELGINDAHKMNRIEKNSLRGFPSLESLCLAHNNFSSIPTELFKTIPKLRELRLSYNPYLYLPETGFGTKNLKTLRIDYCNLNKIPLKFFDTMPNIEYLYLEGNHFTNLTSSLIENFKKIKFVNLKGNKITVFQSDVVQLLANYQVSIDLSRNPFQCDCNFRVGSEVSKLKERFSFSDYKLQCDFSAQNNKTHTYKNQDELLVTLECSNSTSEHELDETSFTSLNISLNSTDNGTSENNIIMESNSFAWTYEDYLAEYYDDLMWFTNHTVLWIVIGSVLFTVLLVFIVVIVKRRKFANLSCGSQHKCVHLRNIDVEDVTEELI